MLICILGRQPRLGLAELEALYGANKLRIIADGTVALVDSGLIERELGGTIKIARVLDTIDITKFDKLTQQIAHRIPRYLRELAPQGKVKFGLSTYGLHTDVGELSRAAIFLKKPIKNAGRSVRVIPNNELFLNSAQVIHNQLTSDVGLELVLVQDGDKTVVARTIHEQDIDAYTLRDRGRPLRDSFVGMLPPKLAQIMINLTAKPYIVSGPTQPPRLLDPFCGTGVVLQEAALYGYEVYGTDVSEKMIRYTRDNLVWLADTHRISFEKYFHQADGTSAVWQQPIDTVVCEGYLGRPIAGQSISDLELSKIMDECNAIMKGFLTNISSQLPSATPLCVAIPAWNLPSGFKHLALLTDIESLGFERRNFINATPEDLLYYREDQIVAREMLVLIKK